MFLQKGTKNALETGRTFATLLADSNLRRCLLDASSVEEFKQILVESSQELADQQRDNCSPTNVTQPSQNHISNKVSL